MTDIYFEFSQHLQSAQAGELDVLTDDSDNLLARWAAICDQQLESLSSEFDPDSIDAWTLERNTWQLVHALYSERLDDSTPPPADPASVGSSKNPYTPPLSVVQQVIEGNRDLIELSAIRDWLHAIPSSLSPVEVRRGYLPYTTNKLKHLKRTGAQPPKGLVDELDPDAVTRAGGAPEGARLEPDDAAYERALIRTLYEYVRTGQLDLALDLCRQSEQSWRAASLSGGRLWFDPKLAPGDADLEEFDAMDEELEEKRARGNRNRRLWKSMCRKIATSSALDPYERALYGALSGDIPSVLAVSTSWEDVVWAHLNSLFEAHLEASLTVSESGRYWNRTPHSVAPAPAQLDSEDPLFASISQPGVGIRGQLEAIFDKLLKSDKTDLQLAAKNPFHVSQMYLIVDKIGHLLETFVERLESAAGETEPETLAHLLRFFAHLILVLRLLKQPLPSYAANRILEAYVHVLEANDQDEGLIAFYASCLEEESAVESYARFLLTFGPDSDITSRHVALRKCLDHNLSLPAIARRTVTLILSSALSSSPSLPSSARAQAVDAYARVDASQLELIRSLEWLTAEKETYIDALSEANALTRYFLSTDVPHAALVLLRSLPADLLSTCASAPSSSSPALQLQIREHLDYIALFTCHDQHMRFSEVWARPPHALEGSKGKEKAETAQSKLELQTWTDGVETLVDELWSKVLEVLEGEWLKGEVVEGVQVEQDGTGPRRLAELAAIRRLLIPDLVLRMHHSLVSTSRIIPSNLTRAFDLATIIADERYGLYHEFIPTNSREGAEANLLKTYLDEPRHVASPDLMTTTSLPAQPALVLTSPQSRPTTTNPTSHLARNNARPLVPLRYDSPGTTSRSRSPSPSPSRRRFSSTSSDPSTSAGGGHGLSALAAAGLGLLSLPPSPHCDQQTFDRPLDDEQEELATPPRARRSQDQQDAPTDSDDAVGIARTSIGFLEPDKGTRDRGRSRKMSFGLGLEGRIRRISFGGGNGGGGVRGGSFSSTADLSTVLSTAGPAPSSLTNPVPGPGKARKLIRRAKSFGTSPLLGGTANSFETFPSSTSPPIDTHLPDQSFSPYSSGAPGSSRGSRTILPRLTTSSLSLASSSHSAHSPISESLGTPLSPLPSSSANVARVGHSGLVSSRPSEEATPTNEPAGTSAHPHWLLAPMVPGSVRHASGTSKGPRRASEDTSQFGMPASETTGDVRETGKERDKGKKKPPSALRRATLSVFGKRDPTPTGGSRVHEEGPRRNSFDPPAPYSAPSMTESPTASSAQSRKNSSGTGLPSLPSLPSLQLSNHPYRMSWTFGSGSSPTASPTASPARRRSNAASPRSGSPGPIALPARPSLTISSVTSTNGSSPSSPVSPYPSSVSSISPTKRQQLEQLPLPPPILTHTLSSDTTRTLVVSLPAKPAAASTTMPTPPPLVSRPCSPSSPPLLRRTASYAASTSPAPSSPLASPALPLPVSTDSSILDRRRTLTRASRSHSDASDRRSPSLATPPLSSAGTYVYGGGRTSVTGGLGAPPGGGYFASAHYRTTGTSAVPRRPGTADSPASGRTSVLGFPSGWSSLFGGTTSSSVSTPANPASMSARGSMSMSRSSSAARSTPSTPGVELDANEFGALFDTNSGKLSRPGTGRKRGLSVGNGIFGSSTSSTTAASKDPPENRARSGSGSSLASDTPLKAPGVLGRMRASTDPNKRVSVGSSTFAGNASNMSLALPSGGTGSRPSTSEGVASLFGGGVGSSTGNRKRGSSLSIVSSVLKSSTPPTPTTHSFRQEPKPAQKYPTPRHDLDETPDQFVKRLIEGEGDQAEGRVAKGDISRVLSASAEPFYEQALAAYLRLFPFGSLPLDIALRLFLCSSSLPPETQQIDRVMEAFARRWCECNPDLFVAADTVETNDAAATLAREGHAAGKTRTAASDIPYVLAFSMVMLNTDAFNPNAKSKMTKADYVKNTRIDGVNTEILEYLYDQITLAPFVFVDEDNPASAFFDPSPTLAISSSRNEPVTPGASLAASNTSSGFFSSSNQKPKIDPYHFIATGQTARFRVDVESHIPFKSPFSYTGTTSFFNATSLHAIFARAPILRASARTRASSRAQPAILTEGTPQSAAEMSATPTATSLAGSPLVPTVSTGTFIASTARDNPVVSSLKITKVGVLSRKEDLAEGGRKAASRKWKAWTVVLTGSQLLFFKDAHFAQSLQQSLDSAAASTQPRPDDGHVLVFTLQTPFKPDAVLSLANTAALFDTTYRRHPNVFRLVAPAGRQYLFQAHDSEDLDSWLHAINYAASFKSANVRIRPLQPPTLRSSTSSTLPPPSPAMSIYSAQTTLEPSSRMLWGSTGSTFASRSDSPDLSARLDGLAMTHRVESTATVRPTTFAKDLADSPAPMSALRRQLDESRDGKPLPELPQVPFSPPLVPLVVNSRADLLRTRIDNLDEAIERTRAQVQVDLRLAKHLAILTPFRSSTRERVLTAIPPIEKRVRQTRMSLVKLVCYREILSRDLLVEDRETERFVRQHSLRRAGSKSVRPQSPPCQHDAMSPRTLRLSQSQSSLTVPTPYGTANGNGSCSETGRDSFESATESLNLGAQHAFTDDELDRLQVRSPPLMQRSRTEQDWSMAMEHLRSLPDPRSGPAEDELELPMHSERPTSASTSRRASNDAESGADVSPSFTTAALVPAESS
ncbi:uncharacterized protein JCM15063_001302 [Sporobolomyces koalae]|uniref:uncharacterized protein n=1 Tax=Sporobolomyces koalae TaxID=500713 RepID=UPI00316F68DB